MTPSLKATCTSLGVLLFLACSNDGGGAAPVADGEEGGACFPNGTCMAGLDCVSRRCVRLGYAPEGGVGDGATNDSATNDGATNDGATNNGASGHVGAWRTTVNLPHEVSYGGVAIAGGFIYVLGGTRENFLANDDVFFASMGAGGDLGPWRTASAKALHTSVEPGPGPAFGANGKVYVVGYPGPETWSAFVGTPDPRSGDIASWKAIPLPSVQARVGTVANGRFYITAGITNPSVWSGVLGADDQVASWGTPVLLSPTAGRPRLATGAHVIGGFLYVFYANHRMPNGSGTGRAEVDYCKLNADGSVAGCTDTTPAPLECTTGTYDVPEYTGQANGFLYVGSSSLMCFADVHSDGVVGNWTNTSPPPQSVSNAQFVINDSFAYLLGGSGITTSYVAPLERRSR